MKITQLKIFIVLMGFGMAMTTFAQQPDWEGLPNVGVQSTYEWAGTIESKFVDGTMEYAFVSGRRKGAGGTDLAYKSQKIGDQMYLLSWHDETSSNYITLVLDFENMVEYHTAIMFYGTDMQTLNFTQGVIDKVTWLD